MVGLFDGTAGRFMRELDGVQEGLLAGGAARGTARIASGLAAQQAHGIAQQNTANPALAARMAGQAGAQALTQGTLQSAQAIDANRMAGAQMAQHRIDAERQRQQQWLGMGLQAGSAGLGMLMSDERSKENIQPGGRAIDQFMQAGDPAMFQYREGMPEGGQQRAGVMAQDIGQTQVGQTMIRQDPQTGMQGLDQNATISALLASVARLSDRLAAVEGPRG